LNEALFRYHHHSTAPLEKLKSVPNCMMGSEPAGFRTEELHPTSFPRWNNAPIPESSEQPFYKLGGTGEILLTLATISIPPIVVSGFLLGLVFLRRVQQTPSPLSALAPSTNENDTNVYYVHVSSTLLVLLASFSSTIASALVGLAMTFISYPVSRRLLRLSESGWPTRFPTAYQLGLLVTLLHANVWAALWRWLKYIVRLSQPKFTVLNIAGYGIVIAHIFVYTLSPFQINV
jgi:hypothetical protein